MRKVLTVQERMTPCICCGSQPVEQHHVLHFAKYPEHDFTVPLCPNCHSLYHILHSSKHGNKNNEALLGELLKVESKKNDIIFLWRLVNDADAVAAEVHRVQQEVLADPDRVEEMVRAGMTMQEIYGNFEFMKDIRCKVLP
jgi:hypothetical protein